MVGSKTAHLRPAQALQIFLFFIFRLVINFNLIPTGNGGTLGLWLGLTGRGLGPVQWGAWVDRYHRIGVGLGLFGFGKKIWETQEKVPWVRMCLGTVCPGVRRQGFPQGSP